jgi:hypothetical protein
MEFHLIMFSMRTFFNKHFDVANRRIIVLYQAAGGAAIATSPSSLPGE